MEMMEKRKSKNDPQKHRRIKITIREAKDKKMAEKYEKIETLQKKSHSQIQKVEL